MPSASIRSAEPGLAQRLDGAVLEHAGTHPVLDVVAIARLEHHRLDALQVQQVRQQQPGRSGTDDRHLGAHLSESGTPPGAIGRTLPVSGRVVMAGPSVTERVAAVLAAFDVEHSAMTLSELARRAAVCR